MHSTNTVNRKHVIKIILTDLEKTACGSQISHKTKNIIQNSLEDTLNRYGTHTGN